MGLAHRIGALAARIGQEVRAKLDASHPGVARAWVSFGYRGGGVAVSSAHNVAGVVRTATGRYRVHFAQAMPDARYCWTALARSSVDKGQQRIAVVLATSDAKTAQYVDVSCSTAASSFADSLEINLVVYR